MTDEELTAIEHNLVVDQSDDSDVLARHASSGASALIAALVQAEADRDRARDAAVALEQEAARVREYAERCARSGSRAYAKAGRELLAILDSGER